MTTSLIQYRGPDGTRGVAALIDGWPPRRIAGSTTTLELARRALAEHTTLTALAQSAMERDSLDLEPLQLLPPIDHQDPAHLLLTGTGLTHLGSAEGRDKMHRAISDATHQTDSMKMFLMGVEAGKPTTGQAGVQPEWFYKGDGSCLVAPGAPLPSPDFALDAGEEPEIAGIYLVCADGTPVRLGYALANEFSDHVTERHNYLWLAHSKLRPAALGPELLLGELPAQDAARAVHLRDGAVLWEKPFASGEANMSHSIANLEHHHFKHPLFRRPGDVHVHFFGTATLSFSDGVRTREGDVFEISAPPFTLPVRNSIGHSITPPVAVRTL